MTTSDGQRDGVLIFSMSVSVDGFVADRDGDFNWGAPDDELFAFHLERVSGLNGYLLGRRLYEAMRVWETEPERRGAPFGEVWSALPKVVFSRTLDRVEGNARLATGSVADELAAIEGDAEVGGADLGGQAFALGLVDELRIFRYPVVVGGGTALLPPVDADVALDLVETRGFDSRVVYERYAVSKL